MSSGSQEDVTTPLLGGRVKQQLNAMGRGEPEIQGRDKRKAGRPNRALPDSEVRKGQRSVMEDF
ncbi:MAG: hypothetical protein Q9207_008087 [Kuettlingeria erythrocarpa]